MGAENSISTAVSNYKIEYEDRISAKNLRYSQIEKEFQTKTMQVKIIESDIESIQIDDPNLTVGWLLSEVTRRYNEYFT